MNEIGLVMTPSLLKLDDGYKEAFILLPNFVNVRNSLK